MVPVLGLTKALKAYSCRIASRDLAWLDWALAWGAEKHRRRSSSRRRWSLMENNNNKVVSCWVILRTRGIKSNILKKKQLWIEPLQVMGKGKGSTGESPKRGWRRIESPKSIYSGEEGTQLQTISSSESSITAFWLGSCGKKEISKLRSTWGDTTTKAESSVTVFVARAKTKTPILHCSILYLNCS